MLLKKEDAWFTATSRTWAPPVDGTAQPTEIDRPSREVEYLRAKTAHLKN